MLPDGLCIPALREPYATALGECLEFLFERYAIVGVVATGTIVRGGGDARSDLDIHVLHTGNFRERLQRIFNGVPCEIFVNHPSRVHGYFEEDKLDRRPVAPHMFATGVVIYDPTGVTATLVDEAQAILDEVPPEPDLSAAIALRYGLATEFEDVADLADTDPTAAAVLLGACVRRLAEGRLELQPGWKPRAKDLMRRLREVDPESARLAELAASNANFADRLAAGKELCRRVTGEEGFFEWASPRQEIEITGTSGPVLPL